MLFAKKYDIIYKSYKNYISFCAKSAQREDGGFMSRDSILKVKEVEAKAEQTVADAKAQAQKMLDQARADGAVLCESTESEILAKREEMMVRIREKSAQIEADALDEAKQEADQMTKDVSLRRKVAEKIIIRGLDSKCR